MDVVALSLCSAFLFGAMTVALRPALVRGGDPLLGALLTVLPALGVALVAAGGRGDWELDGVWPFLLAGILGPGCSQVLFTLGVRDAGRPAPPPRSAPRRWRRWRWGSPCSTSPSSWGSCSAPS